MQMCKMNSNTPGAFNEYHSESFYQPTPFYQNNQSMTMNSPMPGEAGSPSLNLTNKMSTPLDYLHQPSNNYIFSHGNFASPAVQTPAMIINEKMRQSPMSTMGYMGATPIQGNVNQYTPHQQIPSIENNNSTIISQKKMEYSLSNKGIEPKLQNIVSTANLGCSLRLRDIALQAKNAEYNPKRFAAVIMRIKEPKTTALIFSSGKMVCTGAKSEADSKKASRKYAKIIKSLGFPVNFKEFKVQNIVGSCDVKFQISLSKLNIKLSTSNAKINSNNNKNKTNKKQICHYEPEIFPGLIYHMIKPEIVLLIFVSGKIVLTGAKEKQEIYDAFNNIYPMLFKFKQTENLSNKDLHKKELEEMRKKKEEEKQNMETEQNKEGNHIEKDQENKNTTEE